MSENIRSKKGQRRHSGKVRRVSRSNCFFFAFWMWATRGGYFAVRRTRHMSGVGWHWLWSRDLKHWLHYEPDDPKELPAAIWHKVWYKGRVVRGDRP